MRRPALLIGLVMGFVGAAAERSARACSCGPEEILVEPRQDAEDVPRNAAVFLRTLHWDPITPRLRAVDTNTDVEVTREHIPLRSHLDLTVLRPTTLLEPNHSYEILAANRVIGRFQTGAGVLPAPAHFAGLSAILPETFSYPGPNGCVSSCVQHFNGRASRLHLDFPDPPEGTVALVTELRGVGVEILQVAVIPGPVEKGRTLVPTTCGSPPPPLVPGSRICARLLALDATGASISTEEVCAETLACTPAVADNTCEPGACQPPPDAGAEPFPEEAATVSTSSCEVGHAPPSLSPWVLGMFLAISRWRKRRVANP